MTETRIEDGPAIPVGMAIGQVVGQAETVLTKLAPASAARNAAAAAGNSMRHGMRTKRA